MAKDMDQEHLDTPSEVEEPGEAGESNAKGGGRVSTVAFSDSETRPQQMHGSKAYQEETGTVPAFINYTDLTEARGGDKE